MNKHLNRRFYQFNMAFVYQVFARTLVIFCLAIFLGYGLLQQPTPALADALEGQWAPVQNLPWRPVHSIVLPTGKVMIYRNDAPLLWDPIDGSLTNLPLFGYNPFCNGHVLLADGQVMFTGGHIANDDGLAKASYYNPFTNTFTDLPDMTTGRWYPSQVTLGDGNVVTMSGNTASVRNLIPDVWQVSTGTWRRLSDASLSLPLYPAAFLAPNGKVFVATTTSRYLDTAGTGGWQTVAERRSSRRDNYGSACMYDVGKVVYTGGEDPPTLTCETIDLNTASPSWSFIASMPEPRRQQNTTILPDGRVLVTGGSSSSGFNTEDGPKAAIAWNPDTNTWATWATEAEYRGYHSEAILLPDARVASIGGDSHPSLQIFSPPYLFQGPRPTVTSAPASVQLGETFFVQTPDSADITRVTWIRPSAVTHTKNMNQRINKLSFTPVSGGVSVTAPASANDCPPGHYMLFLINSSGVPSIARFIQMSHLSSPAPPNAPTGLTALEGDAQVALTWNAVADAESYTVKRSTTSGGPYTTIAADITTTSYTDLSARNGTTYYYVASAVNNNGESANSSQAMATPNSFLDDLANRDILGSGTVTGSYTDSHANDGRYQSIQEILSEGKRSNRYSFLKHTWSFRVIGGNSVTFYVNAHRTPNNEIDFDQFESDNFVFAYSTDNLNFTDMLTVTKTTDNSDYQLYNLPNTVAGTVYVRVMDTDRTRGNRPLDTIFVDHMFIRSDFTSSPPQTPSQLFAIAGNTQVSLTWNVSAGAEHYRVYRSTTSGSYGAPIASGLTDPSYVDSDVVNNTTYYYTVSAVNINGESDFSNEASAIPHVPTTMYVESIHVTTVNAGKGRRKARAHVDIVNNHGQPASNVRVEGSFSGDITEVTAGTTNANGRMTVESVRTAKGKVSFTFCVDNLTHASLLYDANINKETCDTN